MEEISSTLPEEQDRAIKFKGDLALCSFGADPIVKSIIGIQDEIDGVRKAKDNEHIHRMRVASRRLRTALTIFHGCMPAKRSAHWLGVVRTLTRALGAARDTDVQMGVVQKVYKNATDAQVKPGVRRLLLRLKQQRSKLQGRVLESIDEIERSGTLGQIRSRFEPIVKENKEINEVQAGLYHLAFETITARLNEFLAYEVYIRRVEYKKELHAMRITAKKLRYTIEIFEGIHSEGLNDALQAVRKTQQLVGEIHDCDMWIDYLPHFSEKETRRMHKFYGHSGPFRVIKPGLEYFLANRQKERSNLYQGFLSSWRKWHQQEIWLKLRETLLSGLPAPLDPDQPAATIPVPPAD